MQEKNLLKHRVMGLAALLITATSTIATPASAAVSFKPTFKTQLHIPFQCKESGPDDTQFMVDVDSSFAYKTNSWKQPVGRLIKFQCYKVIGRDNTEFVLFNYGDSQAWVPRSAVRLRANLDYSALPPVDLKKVNTTATPMPIPKGVPAISAAMKKLYAAAAKNGRDPRGVSVIGDCNSEWPVYFGRLLAGATSLSANAKLSKTFQQFLPSFGRASLATQGSFTSNMAFDPTWADPKKCQGNEGPLGCELRTSRASIMLISLGTGDTFTWQTFEPNLSMAVETALVAGAVPVLLTKADMLEAHQGGASIDFINNIIRSVGTKYGVPVIDFALAASNLPNGGLMEEHDASGQKTEPFHLNQQGMDARILLTLQTLNAISGK